MAATSPEQIPDTQRAWVIVRKGVPARALELNEAYPVPKQLAAGEVLVRVQAAAFNPVGFKVMGMLPSFLARRPHVAEHDFAGVVVDANGTALQNGQAVYGWIPVPLKIKSKQGALCEYVRVPARLVLPKPAHLKPTEAAGLALAGGTAYHALHTVLKLEPGQRLFINGGSTSVGIYAIQMARALGCSVAASASPKKEEFVRSLGADTVIDYTKAPVYEQLAKNPPSPKFHGFLEGVGSSDPLFYTRSEAFLAPGGVFTSIGPQPAIGGGFTGLARLVFEVVRPRVLGGTNRKWAFTGVEDRREEFEKFGKLVDEGKVKPVVDSVFAFEDVLKGYERIMSGRATGKVVIKVDPTVD